MSGNLSLRTDPATIGMVRRTQRSDHMKYPGRRFDGGIGDRAGRVTDAVIAAVIGSLPDTLMGFAAGTMLFVINHEIIPESHRNDHEHSATGGLIVGFVLMMLLDTALG